jgi:hypothetical protein
LGFFPIAIFYIINDKGSDADGWATNTCKSEQPGDLLNNEWQMDEMVGIDYGVHHEGLISAVYYLEDNSCIAQAAHHMV